MVNPRARRALGNSKHNSIASIPEATASPPFNLLYSNQEPALENAHCPHSQQSSYELLICLDIGTSKSEAAFAVNAVTNKDPLKVNVQKLPFQRNKPRMPNVVAVKPSGSSLPTQAELIFCRDVEPALQNQSVDPEHCFLNLKQCHYLMNPADDDFKHLRNSLLETQRKHRIALEYLRSFDEVIVKYPRGVVQKFYKIPNHSQQALSSVEDVFSVLFRWTLDYVKLSLGSRSNLAAASVDELFSGQKLRIGVAAPDVLRESQVTKYYDLLVRSGFREEVEILSEARCAAIKVSRDILEYDGDPLHLEQLEEKDIDVCDIGHGTTDISTIRAVKNGSVYQFKIVVEAAGDVTGGKVIEEAMVELIRRLFRKELRGSVPRDQYGVKIEEKVFLEGFRRGIAEAKCDFENTDRLISLTYSGRGNFPGNFSAGDVQVLGKSVVVPIRMLKACYDKFLEPITRISRKQGARKGLLQQYYDSIDSVGEGHRDRFVYLVGGGAIPRYTQAKVQDCLDRIPQAADTPIAYFGQHGEAYVAEGGVLMLSDKDLRQRRFHTEALGNVVESETGVRVVDWFFLMGQSIHDRSKFEQSIDYEIKLDSEDDPLQDHVYPITLKWQFVRTSDEVVGKQYWPRADDPALNLDQSIQLEMDQELCQFIGWTQDMDDTWKLSFNFKVQVILVGRVVQCLITIPAGGIWRGNVETREFTRLMTANLSHLCREDEWTVSHHA